ncbi:MAG: sigma-70 family RNA polymerase sigma factor [Akkermansiaceae bacterium]|nr:sigma-70 family RNA polymerase sigma factor [Akkermansiaceae bacterium]
MDEGQLPDESPAPPRYAEELEIALAALDGEEQAVQAVKAILDDPALRRWLVARGASAAEADELFGDLLTDCFAGRKKSGEMNRLLGRYNGACKLQNFLRRVVLNRFIDRKRRAPDVVSLPTESDEDDGRGGRELAAPSGIDSEDAISQILVDAVRRAFASVDQEKLVLFRLFHSYQISQQRIAAMWGWHYSKVSRALTGLCEELRDGIMAEVRQADPWLQLEWEDFVDLCGDSLDLFDY